MRAASLWEISAAITGWSLANGGKPKIPAPTDEEFDGANWDF